MAINMLAGESEGLQVETSPSLLEQAKMMLSKSKLGFLGKMSEKSLEQAL